MATEIALAMRRLIRRVSGGERTEQLISQAKADLLRGNAELRSEVTAAAEKFISQAKADLSLAKTDLLRANAELRSELVALATPAPAEQRFFGPPPHVTVRAPKPSIYVLTGFAFNHSSRQQYIDQRFCSPKNYTFYFFDKDLDLRAFPMPSLREDWIYPMVADAGRKHLAEWTFFLMEYHKKVLNYPFYAISSRFYEKNNRLRATLDDYWELVFRGLSEYGYGYLPSYDRVLSFINLHEYYRDGSLGTTENGLKYICDRFEVDMANDYTKWSDYGCNYIGFATRKHLEAYIQFYLPMIEEFFDESFNLKRDYLALGLVRPDVNFRDYKPLTLLLELVSHLFFYKNEVPFFGLHYDGTYAVDERRTRFERLTSFDDG